MKVGLLQVLALGCVVMLGGACHTTLEGRLKPGLPGKDTLVSRYEVPYERVYEAAKAVIRENGTLTNDDQVTKVLRGKVDGNHVWVKLDDSEAADHDDLGGGALWRWRRQRRVGQR